MQIRQTNGEKLTYYDEIYQVLDVIDVEITDEALHFDVYIKDLEV